MDQLPELALIAVFNRLPLYDQLKIRGVCRRWKAVIESLLSGRNELVLFYKTVARPLVWFHSNRPVDLLGSMIVNEKFKKSKCFDRFFKNIKRLYVVFRLKDLSKSISINFVNRYRHLEHLKVDAFGKPINDGLEIRVNLPNLISFCYDTTGRTELIRLDCPKMEKLSVPCHFVLNEKYVSFADSLKFLKVASFQCDPGFNLPNLEVLCCQNVFPLDISPFEKLQEIHYFFEEFCFIHEFYHPPARLNEAIVLKGLFRQKTMLKRSELQIYYFGIRCASETDPPIFSGRFKELVKSELNLIWNNSKDFKLEHQRKELAYRGELDAKIAAISAEQAEKLARCIVEVMLRETLSEELALNAKYKILFNYVRLLNFWKDMKDDIRAQYELDSLHDLFPHLEELIEQSRQGRRRIYSAIYFPKGYLQDFADGRLNFRFLARFKALRNLEVDNWRLSPSELREMLERCRFLEEVGIYSMRLEKLVDKKVRTRLFKIRIFLSDNEFRVFSSEGGVLFDDCSFRPDSSKTARFEYLPNENFNCIEEMVNSLDQRGCLRKEIEHA